MSSRQLGGVDNPHLRMSARYLQAITALQLLGGQTEDVGTPPAELAGVDTPAQRAAWREILKDVPRETVRRERWKAFGTTLAGAETPAPVEAAIRGLLELEHTSAPLAAGVARLARALLAEERDRLADAIAAMTRRHRALDRALGAPEADPPC